MPFEVRALEKTVWGDLLFFVNFCMDFQCLFLTAKLLHRPFRLWRAALAAAFGAMYSVAALFWQTSGAVAFLADLCVCLLMCLFAFFEKGRRTVRVFLPFLMYFGVSFAVGGAMSGMASLLRHVELPVFAGSEEVSSGLFFLLAAAGGISTFLWGRVTARRAGQKRARLRVGVAGRALTLAAMVDTANLLFDPISARPVVMVREEVLVTLFPASAAALLSRGVTALTALPHDMARRVRLLHAATATCEGMMLAVAPDWAFLDVGDGEGEVEVLLAPCPLHMGFDECEALLPAELIREI